MTLRKEAPRAKTRWLTLVATVATLTLVMGAVAFAAKPVPQVSFVDYAQCADGTANDAALDCPGGWINGILQASNSTYHEDEVTPQRAELLVPKGAPSSHTVTFSYQTRKGAASVHAYDSLATWNYTQQNADRCQGLLPADCVGGTATTAQIPVDNTQVAPISGSLTSSTADHELSDANRLMTVFGLGATDTLSVSTPVHDCALATPNFCGDPTKDDFATITVSFTVNASASDKKVQFLFGGHMAPSGGPRSWGAGNGASNINGGPYHIKWVAADGASIGNRDNQIMGSAILPLSVTLTTTLHETNSTGVDVTPANNGTSITINLPSDGSGTYVTDVANSSDSSATGTVAFKFYGNSTDCNADTSGTAAGGGALNSGSASSTPTLFTTTGTFYWRAFLTGTGITLNASSACNEILTVRQNTSTATTLHQTDSSGTDVSPSNNGDPITVPVGSYVKDVAALTPSGSTGSVAFAYYGSLTDCQNGTSGTAAGGGTVSTGSASSTLIQFSTSGTFYWKAVFTGSGVFNDSTSSCERLNVQIASPTLASAPRLYPQDYATLSGILSGGVGQLTVKFELFGPSDPNCTGTAAFTQTVNVSGDNTYNTTNSTVWLSSSSATGVYKWQVTFNGNTFNSGNTKACGAEQFNFQGITDAPAS
jgi:hypothetical protein